MKDTSTFKICTKKAYSTMKVGERLGERLRVGDIVCVRGELGSGKTTFIKGVAKGVGVKEVVRSPSFLICCKYEGRISFYHMDLYRVNEDELPQLGYEEYVFGDGAVAIEWAEKIQPLLPKDYVDVHIRWEEDKRYIHIQGFGKSKEVVRALL